MADSDPRIPGNMKLNVRENINAGSAQTLYFGTHPQHNLSISLLKNSETVTLDVTTDAKLSDGSKLTALSNSTINWNPVSTGTNDYFSGDSKLITGVKLVSATASNVQLSLTQIED